jgi:hypothetical protein
VVSKAAVGQQAILFRQRPHTLVPVVCEVLRPGIVGGVKAYGALLVQYRRHGEGGDFASFRGVSRPIYMNIMGYPRYAVSFAEQHESQNAK